MEGRQHLSGFEYIHAGAGAEVFHGHAVSVLGFDDLTKRLMNDEVGNGIATRRGITEVAAEKNVKGSMSHYRGSVSVEMGYSGADIARFLGVTNMY